MRLKGGYNVPLQGRPIGEVHELPEPDMLYIPLKSRRFEFSQIRVQEGDLVHPGQPLATDPANYAVPLLAPRAGAVRLDIVEDHITLESVVRESEEDYHPDQDLTHIQKDIGSVGMKRYKLLALGAWQFMHNAHTGKLPDPLGTPGAVIVSTIHLEPFVARGDVQIQKRLSHFIRGLEHVKSVIEDQPIYVVVPNVNSELTSRVREALRGYPWVTVVQTPLRYGLDNFAILARRLSLKREEDCPVWALGVAGVLAVDRALTVSRPSTVRIVSIGGPGVRLPVHVKAVPGYPLKTILDSHVFDDGTFRVIDGGVLTGETIDPKQMGVGAECDGLTIIPEHTQREFMAWTMPGWGKNSYTRLFLSLLRIPFREDFTTAVRGEVRPCVSCGFCEEVCPAGIMPHAIHKYLYQDAIEAAEETRIDLCVGCGLCSFVCPSKIEVAKQLVDGKETIQRELHPVEEEKASS